MKNHLLTLLLGIAFLSTTSMYGFDLSSKIDSLISQAETNAMSDDQKDLALAHANYIKTKAMKKLQSLNVKLEDYKNALKADSSSEEDEQYSSWKAERINQKIKAIEKKIQNLNDFLLAIELLKAKIDSN